MSCVSSYWADNSIDIESKGESDTHDRVSWRFFFVVDMLNCMCVLVSVITRMNVRNISIPAPPTVLLGLNNVRAITGRRRVKRIEGASTAVEGEWPCHVRVRATEFWIFHPYVCGGVLISEKFVYGGSLYRELRELYGYTNDTVN